MAASRGRILLLDLQDRKSQVHRVKVTNIMNETSGVAWEINFWWMATAAAAAARNESKELRSIGERAEREIRRCSPRRKKEYNISFLLVAAGRQRVKRQNPDRI